MEKKQWVEPQLNDLSISETLFGPAPFTETDGPYEDENGNDWWGGTMS